ncbi:MAG: hypothetical protein B6245_11940 [Desulfobacteraceae bacterium 4572_88]|nr:MAG: hypothetical protein B6245_11940 [Desulfobacteraceae bacterium 4572_88]
MLHILPSDDERIAVSNEHQALELTQKLNISEPLKLELRAGCRRYELDMDKIVAMQEISIPLPDGSSMYITLPGGSIADPHYEEEELYVGAELIRRGKGPHTFLLGMKYSDMKTEDIWVDTNTADGMERWQGDKNWLLEDRNRRVYSAYLQEVFEMTDHLTLTAGLRYDHYNDMGEYLTPRASAVYRLNDRHIFKAQYSQAVLPPTFTDLHSHGNSLIAGNRNLDSEHIRSGELGYIYRNSGTTGRVTLFYSELEDNIEYPKYADAIGGGETPQYRNADGMIKMMGFELEFERMLRDNLRLGGNLSFTDTDEGETGEPLPGSARWLANLAVRYTPVRDYDFALRHHYVGERHRAPDDDRDKVDACDTWASRAAMQRHMPSGPMFFIPVFPQKKNLFFQPSNDWHPDPLNLPDSSGPEPIQLFHNRGMNFET